MILTIKGKKETSKETLKHASQASKSRPNSYWYLSHLRWYIFFFKLSRLRQTESMTANRWEHEWWWVLCLLPAADMGTQYLENRIWISCDWWCAWNQLQPWEDSETDSGKEWHFLVLHFNVKLCSFKCRGMNISLILRFTFCYQTYAIHLKQTSGLHFVLQFALLP